MNRMEAIERASSHLAEGKIGIEREALRVTPEGALATTKHPRNLGSPLTHAHITTDFGEQQLELVTPPFFSAKATMTALTSLEQFVQTKLDKELLWPLSMPCVLPSSIMIAEYGKSAKAEMKTTYRHGLAARYGEHMQMISGIHFNVSFSSSFWEAFHKKMPEATISESYLHICRNFLRYGWLLTYLFGASPTLDPSYKTKGKKTYPYATSLRMSPVGYYSRVQSQNAVSFNSLEEYIADLERSLATKSSAYAKIKTQLNSNILQIENEHYTRVRPKVSLEKMKREGISYLEIRSIDIDPFEPSGIGMCQASFITLFLLFCLGKESPPLSKAEMKTLCENQKIVALEGRYTLAKLKHNGRLTLLKTAAHSLLDEMEPFRKYVQSCDFKRHRAAIDDASKTISGKMQAFMKEHDLTHTEFGMYIAERNRKKWMSTPLKEGALHKYEKEVLASLKTFDELEKKADFFLEGYEDLEPSTQALLKECIRQKIAFTVLDRASNFVELKQGKHTELIRQATKTRLDSYITVEAMGNKEVTKQLLARTGIAVPGGGNATNAEDARAIITSLTAPKIVIKPNSTNYGEGVHICDRKDRKGIETALKEALILDPLILIENFIEGKEFRFLIINGKCCGIIHRDPAHVIGDGIHTIKQLAHIRNTESTRYRPKSEYLLLGKLELAFLKTSGLTFGSIPTRGKKVYLRANSNVSTGGDGIDYTDAVDPIYTKIAIKAAKTLGATITGIDMIIENEKKEGPYSIIEANYNPMISIHENPHSGEKRRVAREVLKALGFTLT